MKALSPPTPMRLLHLLLRRIPLFTSILLNHWCKSCVLCWTAKLTTTPPSIRQHHFSSLETVDDGRRILASAATTLIACCFIFSCPSPSSAGDNLMDYIAGSQPQPATTAIGQTFRPYPGLNAPTEERPQITMSQVDAEDGRGSTTTARQQQQQKTRVILPQGTQAASGKDPILQGLVYFLDTNPTVQEKPRPGPSDTLVILARRSISSESNIDFPSTEILAGAKVEIAKVRFPMLFALYEQNLLMSQSVWEAEVSSKEDVYIDALICPAVAASDDNEILSRLSSSTIKNQKRGISPCTEEQSIFIAHGLAKLITNLPGLPPGETVRAAATLQLQ